MFLVYGILFYVGAIFHRDNGVEAVDMFTAIFAVKIIKYYFYIYLKIL